MEVVKLKQGLVKWHTVVTLIWFIVHMDAELIVIED